MTRTSQTHDPQPTREQLRAQVAETREELGRTVETLVAKTDLKAQAAQARGRAVAATHEAGGKAARTVRDNRWLVAAGAAAGCLLWLLLWHPGGRNR
ncbi:DUF3618 domain-containing protein [Streptomyces sp. NPDC006326]|uniref:DUF3618 domain-containing protein n=1 Tax=Streptomyces sp. NPDC006326 TaxID=3156752 RepID=UPI0033A254FE